jgi:hypothetical protein
MTLHSLQSETDVLLWTTAAALGLAIPAVVMCFVLLSKVMRLEPDARHGRLRLDGNALHGRIVFVDHIDWEREIARWGLDANGCMIFDWHSDHTLYTGYLIEGPSDVDPSLKTAPGAPYGHREGAKKK